MKARPARDLMSIFIRRHLSILQGAVAACGAGTIQTRNCQNHLDNSRFACSTYVWTCRGAFGVRRPISGKFLKLLRRRWPEAIVHPAAW